MRNMKTSNKRFTLSELTDGLNVSIQGDPHCLITGVAPIHQSLPGHITFLMNSAYRKYLPVTQASAVILSEEDKCECKVNAVISHNPYYTYARIAGYFAEAPGVTYGIHESTFVEKDANIHPQASIGAHCVIGKNVAIEAGVVIKPGCVIGDHVTIGQDSQIDANVSIYHHVRIGKRCRIASGAVIGSDGFGFANQKGVWHKVPQLGMVEIGNDVDIGANTTIDRGAVDNTVIGDGVKLDNLIQVGHNVHIGEHTIIAGCVAIAGSTVIGKNCMIGGATCFAGHITICDNTMITGMTSVTKSIRESGIYSSGIVGAVPNHEFRKNNARFYRLENLMQRVKKLEAALKEREEKS